MQNGIVDGTLAIGSRTMDYLSFGRGRRALILLPGLSDGLKTVRGTAVAFAWMYRAYAKAYRVYVFSRVNEIEPGYTTREMARDAALAMDALCIPSASVMGVSQGGMIAQHLALDHPACIEKLVLAVTLSRPNPTVRETVSAWIAMAKNGDYRRLMVDTAEKSYSEAYLRTHRFLLPLLATIGKPKDFSRFIIEAESCLNHDTYDRLPGVKCPTLVLGGCMDKIVGAQASEEIAAQIQGCVLFLYDGLGHAAYEEARDFHDRVQDFLQG